MSVLHVSTPTGQVTLRADRSRVVGRGHDSDVVVADRRVSRKHVLLEPGGAGAWLARDTSANGMWCDGRKVSTVPIGSGVVRLRLGAADGPEVGLAVEQPAGPPPPSGLPSDEAATVFTPGSGRGVPPVIPTPAEVAHAAGPAGETGSPSPSAAMRWLWAIPTFLWLAATGFALGALIALS